MRFDALKKKILDMIEKKKKKKIIKMLINECKKNDETNVKYYLQKK